MITQEIPISLLMDPQKMLIFRKGDYGNQIKIKFPDLTGITSAEFRFIKPDDTFVVSTGEIVENDIIITITQQMSILSGCAIFNLKLINSQSNIYTYVGRALIDDNINLDDYAASVAEVNGLVFPDDFALKSDIPDTDDFATKEYVSEAIAEIPSYTSVSYSETEQDTGLTWVDGSHIYQKTIKRTNTTYGNGTQLNTGITNMNKLIDHKFTIFFSDAEVTPGVTDNGQFIRVMHLGGGLLLLGKSGISIPADTTRTWYLTLYYTKN